MCRMSEFLIYNELLKDEYIKDQNLWNNSTQILSLKKECVYTYASMYVCVCVCVWVCVCVCVCVRVCHPSALPPTRSETHCHVWPRGTSQYPNRVWIHKTIYFKYYLFYDKNKKITSCNLEKLISRDHTQTLHTHCYGNFLVQMRFPNAKSTQYL